jgi:PKD repeat protein
MSRIHQDRRRRRPTSRPRTIEVLEPRTVLAGGIGAVGGSAITAAVGVPVTNAVLATFTITDPSGAPGTQWRALVSFGDGQTDKLVVPVQMGNQFEVVDSHTYTAPGNYTVTVMLGIPGAHVPNGNMVTTQVAVATTPAPPPNVQFVATGLKARARHGKAFHGAVANFKEPNATAQSFKATINFGDQSSTIPGEGSSAGQIRMRGKGRFTVSGSHVYANPGVYTVLVRIQDASGREMTAQSTVRVK